MEVLHRHGSSVRNAGIRESKASLLANVENAVWWAVVTATTSYGGIGEINLPNVSWDLLAADGQAIGATAGE